MATPEAFCQFLIERGISEDAAQICKTLKIDADIAGEITEQNLLSGGIILGDAKRIMRVFIQLTELKEPTTEQDEDNGSISEWIIHDGSIVQAGPSAQVNVFAHSNSSVQYCADAQNTALTDFEAHVSLPPSEPVGQSANQGRRIFNKATDLIQVLRGRNDEKVSEMIDRLVRGEKISAMQVNLLVDILTRDLMKQCGEKASWECKQALAELITTTFPQLAQKQSLNFPACSAFFRRGRDINGVIRNKGKIVVKYAKLAAKIPGRKKRNSIKPALLEFAAANVDETLVNVVSNDVNKFQVKNYFKSTFADRENMRRQHCSAGAIIKKYPKILDYKGELIDEEFLVLRKHDCPNIGESQFCAIMANICKLETRVDMRHVTNITLKAFLVLIDKLPLQQKKRVAVTTNDVIKIVASPLIKFVQPEDDIQQMVDDCEQLQPFIITTHDLEEREGGCYYVVVDRRFFAVDTLLRAFEVLYKAYWCFRLAYEKQLATFFKFFELYIFKSTTAEFHGGCEKLYDQVKIL